MDAFFLFLFRVNIAIIFFYILYRMLFCKDTFFKTRRFILLAILSFSLCYPLIDVTPWFVQNREVQEYMEPLLLSGGMLPIIQIFPEVRVGTSFLSILEWLYMAGVVFFGVRILLEGYSLFHLCRKSVYDNWNGCRIVHIKEKVSPFSFFKYIFISNQKYDGSELDEILIHESVHMRQWHSIDILFMEFISVGCWFNPFLWLMRKELRLNLEHLADCGVISVGYDPKMYKYHLLRISMGDNISVGCVNYFSISEFKRRIRMIDKNRSSGFSFVKYLLVVPLALLLLFSVNARDVVEGLKDKLSVIVVPTGQESKTIEYDRVMASSMEGKDELTSKVSDNQFDERVQMVEYLDKEEPDLGINKDNLDSYSVLYEMCDKYPQYPGGTEKLMDFFRKNLTYPVSALRDSVEGMVVIQFIVETDGCLTYKKIVKGIRKDLDDEALRMLAYMPKWESGEQDGRKVRVRYTLPILFTKNEK
ncbi:MAG: TonB family protein [Barnesiella sp.]